MGGGKFAEVVVWFTCQFSAIHRWKNAPAGVAFLRHPHRHVFHVKGGVRVDKLDRQVEFITLKNQVQAYIKEAYENKEFEYSCEMIAADLIETFKLSFCEVSEDGENGAAIMMIKED